MRYILGLGYVIVGYGFIWLLHHNLNLIPWSAIEEYGEYMNGPVRPSSHISLMAGWIFFIFGTLVKYHGHKIEFDSVPNWSNYGNFAINVVCLLWYFSKACGDFVHISYSYQVPCVAHACKIAFDSVPNLSNHGHAFKYFVYLLWCLREE